MDTVLDFGANGPTKPAQPSPAGAVALSGERLRLLAPQWEEISRTIRRMDQLRLGETEPATLFIWREEQP